MGAFDVRECSENRLITTAPEVVAVLHRVD